VFWKGVLRSLADRGLRGGKLVIADDHKGLRAAASKVFHAPLQRCRVHWMSKRQPCDAGWRLGLKVQGSNSSIRLMGWPFARRSSTAAM